MSPLGHIKPLSGVLGELNQYDTGQEWFG